MSRSRTAEEASEADVRAAVDRVRAHGSTFRQLAPERVYAALARAAEDVRDARSELGAEARVVLPKSTGLTPEMIDWALESTLSTVTVDAMRSLAEQTRTAAAASRVVPSPLVVVVLASNVFTASVRAVFVPMLLGAPVVAKASSRDDVFPRLLARALRAADPIVANGFEVVTFEGGSTSLEDALLAHADTLSVYGGESTVAAFRARTGSRTRLVPHGHGLGVAYVPKAALSSPQGALATAKALALDVAAYDQRGCLSPHAVFVEPGGAVGAEGFAELLFHEGLAPLARTMPRGSLPLDAGAAQLQWRGVAAARGTLFEGDGFAVSYEAEQPLRVSPSFRNVAVHDCDNLEALVRRLQPLGSHLKCVGVAGRPSDVRCAAQAFDGTLVPAVVPVGTMQTPPFDACADGELPFTGFVRYVDVR